MTNLVARACMSRNNFYTCKRCSGAGYVDDRGFPCRGQVFFSCSECPLCLAAGEKLHIVSDEQTRGFYLQGTFETYAWAESISGLEACAFEVVQQNYTRHPDGQNWATVDRK